MSHNKKRNVGIIYELLVRAVSAYLIENDREKAQSALDILSKHYNKETELYKEFRLLNALAKSTVKDTAVAAAILTESKSATRRLDIAKLDKEKSSLIREINHTLADSNFYFRKVPDYRAYATIQTLLNSWREGDKSNLVDVVLFESKMIEWLTSEKIVESTEQTTNNNVDSLVVKLMNEKFNNKYADSLTSSQKDLIKEYVFSIQNDNGVVITSKAIKIKNDAILALETIKKEEKNKIILEKVDVVRKRINELDLTPLSDDKLAKLMTITQLISEIKEN